MYIYLSWLGLTPNEIKTAYSDDYSPEKGVISAGGRDIPVCEEEICRSICVRESGRTLIHGGLRFCGLAAQLASSLGLDPQAVLISGAMCRYFENGTVPAGSQLKAMGTDMAGFEKDFAEYSEKRKFYENGK